MTGTTRTVLLEIVPRGHYYYEGEFVESSGIPNLTFEHLHPKPYPKGWMCTKCQRTMKLFPISSDELPSYWWCIQCEKKVSIKTCDMVFEAIKTN